MIKKCLTGLCCFLLQTFIYAQQIDTKKLDLYFTTLEQNNKFMGSVAVSENGKIIYRRSIGFSNVTNGIKSDENTKYRIGSISKSFTAVLVLKAVEERKLNLNQTIKKFFPSIKNAEKITIENLLNHQSGIHDFTDQDDYRTWNTLSMTEKQMTEVIAKGGSDFNPGSKAEYSNSNYVLLTYILEKSYKKSYSELLEKYITKPVGLKNTYFGSKINTANNECRSYSFEEGWKESDETDISIALGAGGIISTPSDLVQFSDALFEGKILKKESLEKMKTINKGYGFGLMQIPFYDKIGYGHRGGIDKFTSVFSYFPDENISFALTSNGSNYNNNEIPVNVLSAVFNKSFDIPEFSTYKIKGYELDKYLGIYISKEIPIKIAITRDGEKLVAQATGQSATSLESVAKDVFKFTKAGITLEFNPKEKQMILKQGGGEFIFLRE